MQEHSYRLPMYSIECTSHIPTSQENFSIDTHLSSSSSSTDILSNESQTEIETLTSTSTPELNLLLDKLTEILRFRSGCRRHFGTIQQPKIDLSTTNLKRLQENNFETLYNTDNVSLTECHASSKCTGAWKSLNMHHKSLISSRSSHHYHHHNHHHHKHHLEKKRRLPSLLQRLIDEGNLIKEAVHRLKSQRFSHTFKQQTSNVVNTPSTPIAKSSIHLTPSSSSSALLNDTSTQLNSPSNRAKSWFSVFGVNSSTTSMEIGIHDG